jgi:hypothetical protein
MPTPDPDYVRRLIAARCPELTGADLAPITNPDMVPVEVLEAAVAIIDLLAGRVAELEAQRLAAE